MKLGMPWTLGILVAIGAGSVVAGCLGDLKVTPPGGGGAGGAGATGGNGAGGEAMVCAPSSMTDCSTGQLGVCGAGKATCSADGSSLGPCLPANASFDDCKTPDDEDCDGKPISKCTGLLDWTVTRPGAAATPNDDSIFAVATVPSGGYVVTGLVDGSITNGTIINSGTMYLAKLDAAGTTQWEKTFTATKAAGGRAVAIDSAGNIVVVGEFEGDMTIDGLPLKSVAGSRDILIGKFNAMGQAVWVKAFGADTSDGGTGVALDASDNIVFTGHVHAGIVDFGGGPIDASADDAFVAKFSPDGTHIWSKVLVNPSDQQGRGVATTASGDVVLVGDSNATFTVGGAMHTVSSGIDCFIARFSGADGAFSWSRGMAGGNDQGARGVTILPSGNAIAMGRFQTGIDFGDGQSLVAMGGLDAFLAEFRIDTGAPVRSKRFGVGSTYAIGMAADGAGHVYLSGAYSGTLDLGAVPSASVQNFDAFAVKLDSSTWNALWVQSSGNSGNQYALPIAVDQQGRAIVGGAFEKELVEINPPKMLTSTGGFDLFTMLLEP